MKPTIMKQTEYFIDRLMNVMFPEVWKEHYPTMGWPGDLDGAKWRNEFNILNLDVLDVRSLAHDEMVQQLSDFIGQLAVDFSKYS